MRGRVIERKDGWMEEASAVLNRRWGRFVDGCASAGGWQDLVHEGMDVVKLT